MVTNNTFNNQVLAADVIFNGGTMSIGTDATSGAINIGTGAAARTTTIGNTSGASVLALKCGTGDMTLASATGTIISANDTGEITYPLQSAFLAYNSVTDSNVTGDGTVYHIIYDTEVFDQNSDYNNGTGNFTAPITGRYRLATLNRIENLIAASTDAAIDFVTSNRTYHCWNGAIGLIRGGSGLFAMQVNTLADMDAADTAFVQFSVAGATKTVGVTGNADAYTVFSGQLEC